MKIIGIGEVVWDCFPEGKRLGGAPINFCFFAKELGAESYPVTAIGEDELGFIQRHKHFTCRQNITGNIS